MATPTVSQESIDALLAHMSTLSQAVNQIQSGQGSMDQAQLDTLIASIKGNAPTPKPTPVYARNPGQLEVDSIIDYSSSTGAKRYRYATAALSLSEFDHTSGKVLEITTSLAERSHKSGWGAGTGAITNVKVGAKTYDLFKEYGQFTVAELIAHIQVYITANNERAFQNSEMLATCILASVSAGTRAELHAIYDECKIGGEVFGELVFKALMNKAIVDNKQTTRHLQDQYDALPQYMTTCDSDIAKFILEWRNVVSLLEARGVVLADKFKILWRSFELCKDAYFVDYMARKQEAHEEDESPTPSLTVDKLLKFALDKFTDRSRIDNHIWGSSSKREADFVALSAEVSTLKGNLKLAEKIAKKLKSPAGKDGPPKGKGDSTKECWESKKDKEARIAQWKTEQIALKKVPPVPGGPTTRTFTKKDHPGFNNKSKPFYWCIHHLMWCVHTSAMCKVGLKQAEDRKANKSKSSGGGGKKEQAMAAMIDMFGNHDDDSDSE
jgi:hypothetical protein